MNPFDVSGFVASAGLVGLMVLLFVETGLLVGFVFPGDSVLFTAGVFAAQPEPFADIRLLCALLPVAAALGDQCGYLLGRFAGPRMLRSRVLRWIGDEPVTRTQAYFDRFGSVTVLFAKFIGVVRTLTPVMAGLARMNWGTFTGFSVLGSLIWASGITVLGYLLGDVPLFRDHFELLILASVGTLVVPMVVTVVVRTVRARRRSRGSARSDDDGADEPGTGSAETADPA